jgi:small subunit ribosomal protein S20
MPIIKSAKKRVRVASKAAARNTRTKRNLRTAIKSFQASITGANASKAQSALDQAVKKGVMHKNKAARKKKQLAAAAKAAGVKTTAKAKATKTAKAAAKKTAAKSTQPSKTASKTKKPAAKK